VTPSKAKRSGYKIERVYVAEQEYRVTDPDAREESAASDTREVAFGWDWRPLGPRRFEVVIEVSVEPSKDAPEVARVRLFGLFAAGSGELTIPFRDFVRHNAPAILFPYAREVVSTMTGRGPYGAFHIDPLNVREMTGGTTIDQTLGYKYLVDHPDVAATFGLYAVADNPTPSTTG
jgi:preprotein translocase subunit SecB